MYRRILLGLFFIFSSIILVTCNDDDSGNKTVNPVVYVGGYDRNDTTSPYETTPCYWTKNGSGSIVKTILNYPATSAKGAPVTSMFVSGGQVYSSGWYYDAANKYYPCYWTGQTMTPLYYADGHKGSAGSIFVESGTVYAAGNDTDATSVTKPCYWDGSSSTSQHMLDVSTGTNHYTTSLFVVNGTVYIGGRYNSSGITNACYWSGSASGTTMVPLTSDTTAGSSNEVATIYVSSGTVYAGGNFKSGTTYTPCYWIDTATADPVLTPLSVPEGVTQGFVQSIYVVGSTVYACGYYKNPSTNVYKACYWINGERTDLPVPVQDDRDYYANALTVFNGTVYIAGSYFDADWKSKACYWRGTELINLPGAGDYVTAISIVVK